MLDELLAGVAALPVATALKASIYVYPFVNAVHIMGLATLFGAIVALDLRLLGVASGVPLRPLALHLPRVAACGLAVAVLTGLLLFTVKPFEYADNRAFQVKAALVVAGALHAAVVHASAAWRALVAEGASSGRGLRGAAALSLAIWTSAIVAGRLIAF